MSNLVRLYKARYEEAEDLAVLEEYDAALDICWELRLKPELGIYRRARVNLLIASILPDERYDDILMFANETLDLFDILRQQKDPEGVCHAERKHLEDLEEVAKRVIADAEADRSEYKPLLTIKQDAHTHLLSETDYPEAPPTASKTIQKGVENLKLDVTSEAMEQETVEEEIIWDPGFIKNPQIEYCPPHLPQIEGYLRDAYYKPFQRNAPPAQQHLAVPQVRSNKPRLPTPADSSPPRIPESTFRE